MRFYRIEWPVYESGLYCDWATSWDEAHRLGRARSDYYRVILIELPERKASMLAFLKENVRRPPGWEDSQEAGAQAQRTL